MAQAGITYNTAGQAINGGIDQHDLYSTVGGDFGTVTRASATTLTCTAAPPGTLIDEQFIAVVGVMNGGVNYKRTATNGLTYFEWTAGTKTLTIVGGEEFPATADFWDIQYIGPTRGGQYTDDGEYLNLTNVAAGLTAGADISMKEAGMDAIWIDVDTLTNMDLYVYARGSESAALKDSTLALLGITKITQSGSYIIDSPALPCFDIQLQYERTNATNAIEVYISRSRLA